MKTTATNFLKKLSKTLLVFTAITWLCGASGAKAQHNFAIPDANFAAWLTANIPSAMTGGNLMDTTNVNVIYRSRISVKQLNITNLSGIQYFTWLQTLDCHNNQLTSLPDLPIHLDSLNCGGNFLHNLPALPNTLTFLKCNSNFLDSLPALPSGLLLLNCTSNQLTQLPALPSSLGTQFDCSYNNLTSLPTLWDGLWVLWCGHNQLTSLPAFPSSLYKIDCSYNQLTSVPIPYGILTMLCSNNLLTNLPTLPSNLREISCGYNQLTSLPALPLTLELLACSFNQLTSLPSLPDNLVEISCSHNQLTSLPTLPTVPNNNHFYLYCGYNQLTSLPALPNKTVRLQCDHNQLTSLPPLSICTWLETFTCAGNNISCFPPFPNSINPLFDISGNPFTCLPNYIPGMNSSYLAYPLCFSGGCTPAEGIVGFAYKDMNSNCVKDNGDRDLVNIPMKIYDSNNNLLGQTYTAINGIYTFSENAGTYNVLVDTAGLPFEMQCAYPGVDSTVTTTITNPLDTNVNFSITCKPGFDVGVQSVVTNGLAFPGSFHRLSIVAGDLSQWYNHYCPTGISGTVQITVTGPVIYMGPAAGALTPSVSGNVYTYTIADFAAINNATAFNLLLTTYTSAQAGDQICVNVTVTPGIDNNVSNNAYQYCYLVVNSHDPNMKEVYPKDVEPGYEGWFTYTIHFQNTGTAAAINILVADTLDTHLDLKTFQLINYSHQNTVSLTGNLLEVRFPSINLPDSTSDLNGSSGFIQYRIKPKGNLPLGTVINNTANIYFDFNAAVVTNTTHNNFVSATSISKLANATEGVSVYPNPFSDNTTFIIQSDQTNETYSFEMMDVLGKTVKSLNGISTKQFQVSRNGLESGIYFYKIYSATSSVAIGKVVIK